MKLHGMFWWIDRWRKSTAYIDMTLAEQGAYRNLLDEAFLRGGAIPNDRRILAKASGDSRTWKRVHKRVLKQFVLEGDGWHNKTLDKILATSLKHARKQQKYRERIGNTEGNGDGNGEGNAGRNTGGNAGGNAGGYPKSLKDLSFKVLANSNDSGTRARYARAYDGPRGLWVSNDLHAHFIKLRNTPDASEELLGWYAAVALDWSEGAHKDHSPGGDVFKFWRARFDEQWPPAPSAVGVRGSKTTGNAAAIRAFVGGPHDS